jgi:hypothetical protein
MVRPSRRLSKEEEQSPDNDLAMIEEEDEDEVSSTNVDSISVSAEMMARTTTKDEKLVLYSRVVVLAVLMLTALVISGMTYQIVSDNEHDNFQAEVSEHS